MTSFKITLNMFFENPGRCSLQGRPGAQVVWGSENVSLNCCRMLGVGSARRAAYLANGQVKRGNLRLVGGLKETKELKSKRISTYTSLVVDIVYLTSINSWHKLIPHNQTKGVPFFLLVVVNFEGNRFPKSLRRQRV